MKKEFDYLQTDSNQSSMIVLIIFHHKIILCHRYVNCLQTNKTSTAFYYYRLLIKFWQRLVSCSNAARVSDFILCLLISMISHDIYKHKRDVAESFGIRFNTQLKRRLSWWMYYPKQITSNLWPKLLARKIAITNIFRNDFTLRPIIKKA